MEPCRHPDSLLLSWHSSAGLLLCLGPWTALPPLIPQWLSLQAGPLPGPSLWSSPGLQGLLMSSYHLGPTSCCLCPGSTPRLALTPLVGARRPWAQPHPAYYLPQGRKWWMEADEPWQALACCMEIAQVVHSPDPTTYISHFPVHQVSWGTLLWTMPGPCALGQSFLRLRSWGMAWCPLCTGWCFWVGLLCASVPRCRGSWPPISVWI